MRLLTYLRGIKKAFSQYQPSIKISISSKRLLENLHEYQRHYPSLAFAPVLKSNAYGHGLILIAKVLAKEKVPFFVVDSLFEAQAMRQENIKNKILIVGYTNIQNINHIHLPNVSFTITSLEQLQTITTSITQPTIFHLKIDTGMHRQGLLLNQLDEAIKIIKNNSLIKLEGVCSHLADADNPDKNFSDLQINNWNQAVQKIKTVLPQVKFFHLSATAGIYFNKKIQANVVRLGIGLYGINLSPSASLNLQPVLQMESIVSSIKTIGPNEAVGYNLTFKTNQETKIATIPVGYFEGADRRLSNCGMVKIQNYFCPIRGRVSMNIISVDVTAVPHLQLEDPVTIISNNPTDQNSVMNIAKIINTTPHEIFVHLPPHLRRVIQ